MKNYNKFIKEPSTEDIEGLPTKEDIDRQLPNLDKKALAIFKKAFADKKGREQTSIALTFSGVIENWKQSLKGFGESLHTPDEIFAALKQIVKPVEYAGANTRSSEITPTEEIEFSIVLPDGSKLYGNYSFTENGIDLELHVTSEDFSPYSITLENRNNDKEYKEDVDFEESVALFQELPPGLYYIKIPKIDFKDEIPLIDNRK